MKNLIAISLCFITLNSYAEDHQVENLISQNRNTAKLYGSQLKQKLSQAMKKGGPLLAISVCKIQAPKISSLMDQKGLVVKRTSLKYRNSDNAPDEWETEVLNRFNRLQKAGANPKKLEFYDVVNENGQDYFRHMKAIPTGNVCLACHGKSIAPSLIKRLDELYVEDKARGYQVGEVRGAFTFKTKLD